MIKRLAITVLGLVLIHGMGSTSMAIQDGTYDFYGTFSLEGYYADGVGTNCALAVNGLPCPSSVAFCIKDLDVTSNVITSNIGTPHYGIAMGILDGTPLDLDYDGAGPVNLTVGSSSADSELNSLNVGESGGGSCSGAMAASCVNSLSRSMVAPGGDSGTVIGAIPYATPLDPTTFPLCAGGLGSYGDPVLTTENAEARVSNENASNQSLSDTGSGLAGSDPTYSLTLVDPSTVFRTTIGGIPIGTDVFGFNTFEGTLCRRTAGTCIPVEFSCPAEDD